MLYLKLYGCNSLCNSRTIFFKTIIWTRTNETKPFQTGHFVYCDTFHFQYTCHIRAAYKLRFMSHIFYFPSARTLNLKKCVCVPTEKQGFILCLCFYSWGVRLWIERALSVSHTYTHTHIHIHTRLEQRSRGQKFFGTWAGRILHRIMKPACC